MTMHELNMFLNGVTEVLWYFLIGGAIALFVLIEGCIIIDNLKNPK